MKIVYAIFVFVIFLIVVGCTQSEKETPLEMESKEFNLLFYSERNTNEAINSKHLQDYKLLENLEIVYIDIQNKLVYFCSSKDTNSIYYSKCDIDSAFFANLTGSEQPDKIYLGSFYPTQLTKIKTTFITIYSFNPRNNTYQNSFNTFYFVDKSFIEVEIVYNLMNSQNVLFVSNHEGSGNFLEINLIAKKRNRIVFVTPDLPPLSQGEYLIDTGKIYLMEGFATWEITQSKDSSGLELRSLDSIPIVDFREGDKIIKFKKNGNKISTDSKIYVCNWTGVIHLQIEEPNNELILNYDPFFFKRKFNQLIPQKKGITYIELRDPDFNIKIYSIRIIIN